MQFELLIAVVPEDREDELIQKAKQAGAGGVNVIKAKALGLEETKVFFGFTTLSLADNVSLLMFVLPKKLLMNVFKTLKKELNLDEQKREFTHEEDEDEAGGLLFTMPISHVAGIDLGEMKRFEENVKDCL